MAPGSVNILKIIFLSLFITSKDGGHGLGLSISKKLLNSFEGDITLEDKDSKGAQFNIYLPEM